ncbi:hypothetical protein [Oxalicibacterium solurbis]|nr:hypothetical protein [Oxalicibacterium solurbis]
MMTYIFKLISLLGVLGGIVWFAMVPDFAAVFLGILSLAIFMMTFLPVAPDEPA